MRVLVLGYQNRTGVAETIQQLGPLIEQKVEIVQEDLTGKADLSCTEADIALVFGGDGSILRAVQQMGTHQLPVLSVNLGRLGFLAGLSRNDSLPDVLEKLSLLSAITDHHGLRCFGDAIRIFLRSAVKYSLPKVTVKLDGNAKMNGTAAANSTICSGFPFPPIVF